MKLHIPLDELRSRLKIAGLGQGLVLIAATTLAFALDYLFNLLTGRLLDQSEFGIFVALTGVGQIVVVASRVIQTIVTRYIARFQAVPDGVEQASSFFRLMWRSAWIWGTAALAAMLLISNSLARFLKISDVRPVWALAAATMLMVVRPVVGGALQGKQQFAALGGVQIVQATLRLGAGMALIGAGLGAFGALAALPLASFVALLYGAFVMDRALWRTSATRRAISLQAMFRFSAYAAAGLIGYALLVNMDAILAKRFFDPVAAGNYGAAVTLGKVIQFFPLAIIMILFPKAAQRQAAQRDPAGILIPAMIVVLLICGGVVLIYALFTDTVVRLTLGDAYQVDGRLLGLEALAMLLYSLSNVWLNYFLSTERPRYVFLVLIGIPLQAVLMVLFHNELWHLPAIMAFNGAWMALSGYIVFVRSRKVKQATMLSQ